MKAVQPGAVNKQKQPVNAANSRLDSAVHEQAQIQPQVNDTDQRQMAPLGIS